jgi:ABC-2 type transport system permease protein
MAVYERSYKRYVGALTPQWTRPFVLPRFALGEVFRSKLFTVFFIISLLPPLFLAGWIYLYHNASTIFAAIPDIAQGLSQSLAIDARLFERVMSVQCFSALILAIFVGPGLVSQDLANNGLPLYLSRPISRAEYVLGKFSVLGIVLSLITWVPAFALYFLQSGYAGLSWGLDNVRIAVGSFVGSWAWIVTVSFLALALSAWVRWRPVAGFLMAVVFLGGGFFGMLVNGLFRTDWGNVVNLVVVMGRVWEGLFDLPPETNLPVWAAWGSLAAFVTACVYMLHRKIRAYEVVS